MYKYKDKDVLRIYKGGTLLWDTYPPEETYADDESILELQQGTFMTDSGGTLTFADGSSTVFTQGNFTTYSVTAAQAGTANFKGSSSIYTVRGTSLVKILHYPRNATTIRHTSSQNLIEVPVSLPPNVTSLVSTFFSCSSFNHPNVTLWDVSKVTNMYAVFRYCTKFNQDISSWCVPLIDSRPTFFSTGTNLPLEYEPVWGTCPERV